MQEGLRLHSNYSKELKNYFKVDTKKIKFYFVQPYASSIIQIINADLYNEEFFKKVLNNLKDSKNRINLLIEKSVKPFLNSFGE